MSTVAATTEQEGVRTDDLGQEAEEEEEEQDELAPLPMLQFTMKKNSNHKRRLLSSEGRVMKSHYVSHNVIGIINKLKTRRSPSQSDNSFG